LALLSSYLFTSKGPPSYLKAPRSTFKTHLSKKDNLLGFIPVDRQCEQIGLSWDVDIVSLLPIIWQLLESLLLYFGPKWDDL